MKLILASKSPRRAELMDMLGFPYEAIGSDVSENVPDIIEPSCLVEYLAKSKADSVFQIHPGDCVIGCDTLVYINGEILGKPYTKEKSVLYLKKLRGCTHSVYTGICVRMGKECIVSHDCTEVSFGTISDEEIEWYVSTGDPFDKAGAYGIQGPAALFIETIRGNYFNVVGLPIPLLYHMLKKIGYPLLFTSDE